MRRTLHRRAGKGALAATVTMLALGVCATSATADKGGVPHAGSNGQGRQGSSPPAASEPASPGQDQGQANQQAPPAKPAKRHKKNSGGGGRKVTVVIAVCDEPILAALGTLPSHPWLSHLINVAMLEHPMAKSHLGNLMATLTGGGELRLSLSSPFDPRQAEGFRCSLFPTERVGDVATMLLDLLRDCRVTDVRVLEGVHADRDQATGLTLLFKPDAMSPGERTLLH